MSKRLYDSPTHLMEVQGGSFVRSLAACFYAADPANKLKLREAFSQYFESYEERFRQHRAAVAQRIEPEYVPSDNAQQEGADAS